MDSRKHGIQLPIAFISLAAVALFAAGCGSSSNTVTNSSTPITGSSFVVGTDAPVTTANVTSFTVPIESISATTASNTTVQLVSGTPTIDFARFNGLQTLLDMNGVTTGTYTSISITLGSATIGYLNTTSSGAPTIVTMAASYASPCASTTSCTITETLPNPLIVTQSGSPVGVRIDFDLYKSIGVSGSTLTGSVTPTFNISTVANNDTAAHIDSLDGAVVSVNTTAQSFVVQGPHGRQFTVNVSGTTEWANSEGLSALTTSSIVDVSGTLDKVDATIDADAVAILSQNGFFADGQVTYVTPTSGAATSFDLYVRALLPTTTGINLGDIAQVNLSGSENFFIHDLHDGLLSQFLFNDANMMPGQHVAIGGPATGASNENAVTAKRVVLRHWGFNGTVVANGASQPANSFQMQINGFAGVLVPQTVTVYNLTSTAFRYGLTSVSDAAVGKNLRVVGLLVKDPSSGKPVLLAHDIDALN
jgi:hypothetical protein